MTTYSLNNGHDAVLTSRFPTPSDLVKAVDEIFGDEDVSLILEPGRSIIGNAAILLTTVLGVKPGMPTRLVQIKPYSP